MTSRERVLTALNHREPDKVPIDFGATTCTSPTRVACRNLRTHLGMAPEAEPVVTDRIMDAVLPADDLLRRYQSDFRIRAHEGAPRQPERSVNFIRGIAQAFVSQRPTPQKRMSCGGLRPLSPHVHAFVTPDTLDITAQDSRTQTGDTA